MQYLLSFPLCYNTISIIIVSLFNFLCYIIIIIDKVTSTSISVDGIIFKAADYIKYVGM